MVRIKYAAAALVLVTALLLFPVSKVLAADEEGTYSDDIPYLQGIEVVLDTNNGLMEWGWFAEQFKKQRSIFSMDFEFDRLSAVDYTKYEVVFDFELRSQLDDGTIKIHPYTYVTELTEENSPGFFDNLLISITLKDDYFKQHFTWQGLIANSPDYKQKFADTTLSTARGLNQYNTVVTQVDCYLREKTTGDYGLISRFNFVWDENFWNQKCSAISYKLIVPETQEVLGSQDVQNNIFAGSLGSEGVDWYQSIWSNVSKLSDFIADVPEALYIIASNISLVGSKFLELLKVVFPFVPVIVFQAIGALLVFAFIIALFRLIKE